MNMQPLQQVNYKIEILRNLYEGDTVLMKTTEEK